MVTLVNRAKVSTATTGTGTITLGAAESGYQSFADAGVVDTNVVRYVIEDGDAWEIGSGTYTAAGTTLTRTVSESSNADAAISLTGSAVVYVSATAADLAPPLELYAENPVTPVAPSATGTNAVAIGSESVSAGLRSVSLGDSYASGTDSLAAATADNTSSYGATGTSSVAIGRQSKSASTWSTAIGAFCLSSSTSSVAIGNQNTASGSFSLALGRQSLADKIGKFAFTGHSLSGLGLSQTGMMVLVSDTTDATPEALTSNNSTAGSTNQVILPNNSAYFFSGTVIARQDAASGTDMGAWEIKGAIRREGTAAATTLVKSTINEFSAPVGWNIALTADTVNGGLAITVTGAAATNIRWVATVNTSEVTY
jgi:hypothetical protein